MLVKVLGYDRYNNEYYRLGFCDEKDISEVRKYHVENGWREMNLRFEEVEKVMSSPEK
jgi:hypothetical protein